MKKEELYSERVPFRDVAERLHEGLKDGHWYVAENVVAVKTTTPRRIGPWTLPRIFDVKEWVTTKRKTFSLNQPANTVIMIDDGMIALLNPKSGQYESFDFQTSSSDDFDIVRRVLRKWKGINPRIRTVGEHSDRLELNFPPRDDNPTPH
jgi:hypothetical protein